MPSITEILIALGACIVSAALGGVGGWFARGDCTALAKATAATSTAQAETKAANIDTKKEVKDEKRNETFRTIEQQVAALPPHVRKPACRVAVVGTPPSPLAGTRPAPLADDRELDADELRLWNAGNAGIDAGVQQAGVDAARGGAPDAAKPVRP